jgi:hypothetical protein
MNRQGRAPPGGPSSGGGAGPNDDAVPQFGGSATLTPMKDGTIHGHMNVRDALAVLRAQAIVSLGPQNYFIATLVAQCVAALVVAYAMYRIVAVLWARAYNDPVGDRIREIEAKDAAKGKGAPAAKGKGGGAAAAAAAAAAAPAAADGDAAATSRPGTDVAAAEYVHSHRTRAALASRPTSSMKGFDLVSVCAVSPCSNILVVAERAKRTLAVYAQHKGFVATARTTGNVVHPLGPQAKPLVTATGFSPDGRHFAAFDIAQQAVLVFRNDTTADGLHTEGDPSATVTTLWSLRLSDAPELPGVARGVAWGTQFAAFFPLASPDRLCVFLHNGCVMLFAPGGARVASAKKSIGNTVAWGVADGIAVCAGSQMTEAHLNRVRVRDGPSARSPNDGASVALERFGPALSPASRRISHALLTPDMSTLVLLPADEAAATVSFFYGIDLDNGVAPKQSVRIEDGDYLDPALRPHLRVDIAHVAPNPTFPGKKVLYVTLRLGGDVVVYRVDTYEAMAAAGGGASAAAAAAAPPKLVRVLEVHGAHGEVGLVGTGIVGRGRGLITATECDVSKSLHCWDLLNSA